MNKDLEVMIQHHDEIYFVNVEGTLEIETVRKGSPSKLTLTIVEDKELNFCEGNAIRVKYQGTGMFYGYVFDIKKNKENTLKLTCYDQLRYLKNKDTIAYTNKRTGDLIHLIAKDFGLDCGYVCDTGYYVPMRIEDNKSLMDMINISMELTLQAKKQMFIMYDAFGKIVLKNVSQMKLDTVIDVDLMEDFDYSSTIGDSTYTQVKLYRENKDTGKRDIYIAKDQSKINSWGKLQLFEKVGEGIDAKAKADALLKMYSQKTKTLSVKDVISDIRVRGGSLIGVYLNIRESKIQNYMLVDKCKHKFSDNEVTMDLDLVGGEFISTLATVDISESKNTDGETTGGSTEYQVLREVNAEFTAYYPANTKLQGGYFDAMGNRLNPDNRTCAAPRALPFGTKIQVNGTNTDRDGVIYTVTDRGGAIKVLPGAIYRIDLLMRNKQEAYAFGRKRGKIKVLSDVIQTSGGNKASKVIQIAKSKMGCKYVWGATGPNTFDCSGLMLWSFRQIGVKLPRTSKEQSNAGQYVSRANLKPGDLVFFNTSGKGVSHVGLYIGNNQFVHAPNRRTVVKINDLSGYYLQRYVTGRRVI